MDLEKGAPAYEKTAKIKAQVDRMGTIIKKLNQLNEVETRDYAVDTKILTIKRGD